MILKTCLLIYLSEVGGSEFVVRPPPYWEIDFDCACVCVACVRASLRACEAAWTQDASSVAGRGRVQFVAAGGHF